MILDFSRASRDALERTFDVCVVGTGPAGIALARRLAAHRLQVALMEAGDLYYDERSQEVYLGDIVGHAYHPLDVTRLRYFGGSSNHWGGRSRELEAHDFAAHPHHPLSGWPIGKGDLDPYLAATDDILDLPPSRAYPNVPLAGAEDALEIIRFRHSPPTRFSEKYHDEIAASEAITLFVNANLVDLRLDDALGTVTAAIFRSYEAGDPGAAVRARHYCLCLGGIENPRFLLNARSQIPVGIGNDHDLVGRFFCEHPNLLSGQVLFEGRVPPNTEYTPTPALMQAEGLLNFNLLLRTHGFDLRTELMRSVACATPFGERLAARVLGRPINCYVGGFGQYLSARQRDDYDSGRVGIIFEQALNRDSRLVLTPERDRFGHQRIALDWRLSPLDFHTVRGATMVLGQYLAEQRIGRVQIDDWLLEDDPTPPPGRISGIHHHMCTTRMSTNPREGVVDRDCRVHGLANLYLGGSSVFATAGQANPTYTIVQLALRLGDHLANQRPA